MNWDQIVKKVPPHIVKIETQSGHGSGFLFLHSDNKSWCGIATAAQVTMGSQWGLWGHNGVRSLILTY